MIEHRAEALRPPPTSHIGSDPVPSGARTPSEHCSEAGRLIDAAESSTNEVTAAAALLAVAHAVLATVPKRAVPKRRPDRPARHTRTSARDSWLFGGDE